MKRTRLFFMTAVVLMLVSSASLAATWQKFTRMSVQVPEGWTGSESSSGATVYVTNNANTSLKFSIQVVNKLSRTLEEIANSAYTEYHGIGSIEHPRSSAYLFYRSGGQIIIFDDTDSFGTHLHSGWCTIIYLTNGTITEDDLITVISSVTTNEDYVYNHGIAGETGSGTLKQFTRMTVRIPDGWTGSENSTGDTIYIKHTSPVSNITLQLVENNGRTLKAIAEEAYTTLNGTGELQEQNGIYMFGTSYNGVNAAFVFDHLHSNLVEGYSCIMYVTDSNPGSGNLSTVQNSLTINESWLNRNADDNTPADDKNADDNKSDDDKKDDTGNNGDNDTSDTPKSSSSGGGCNSGVPSLAFVLAGIALLKKK